MMREMIQFFALALLSNPAAAIPANEHRDIEAYKLAEPILDVAFSVPRSPLSIFKRQGCPNLYIACPNNQCCSTETTCCGALCCDINTTTCGQDNDGTVCCLPLDDISGSCGGSGNSNPCPQQGTSLCAGLNACCPTSDTCFLDTDNQVRCAPPEASPTPTPDPGPTPTPVPTFDSTSIIPAQTSSSNFSPTPTPDAVSGSVSSPTPSPSPSQGFWTPARIGGVAGGSAGAVILFFIIILYLIRRRNFAPHYYITETTSPIISDVGPPSSGPTHLTEYRIRALTENLDSTQAWQNFYNAEAQRIAAYPNINRPEWLFNFAVRALDARDYHLRWSTGRFVSYGACAAFGWIPGVKILVNVGSNVLFTDYAIKGFGMADHGDVNALHQKACSKAGLVTTMEELAAKILKKSEKEKKPGHIIKKHIKELGKDENLQEQLKDELNKYLSDEIGADEAAIAMTDFIHVLHLLGHLYAAGKSVLKIKKGTDKTLIYLKDRALDFHTSVFVVNAC